MDFSHFNTQGRAHMVDITQKSGTSRTAVAAGCVYVNRDTLELIKSGGISKGDVLGTAQIAGIIGAKRTCDIIPMCHPVMLTGIDINFEFNDEICAVEIKAAARCVGATGVEMEALTAVSVAALTVYDMCKSAQKDITIGDIRLISKRGGKNGDYIRSGEQTRMKIENTAAKARVAAVCVSDVKGVQKTETDSVTLITEHGIKGDAHAGKWHRQVSLLGIESVRKIQSAVDFTLEHGAFAENILTEGLTLYKLPVGTQLKIGSALTEVTQIGKECHEACAIRKAAGDCVMPREGIFVKVLESGVVKAGDEIVVLSEFA